MQVFVNAMRSHHWCMQVQEESQEKAKHTQIRESPMGIGNNTIHTVFPSLG